MTHEKITILVVEDSSHDAELVQQHLLRGLSDEFQIEIKSAKFLGDAEYYLRSQSFSALIVDLNLPDCRGIETLRRLRLAAPVAAIVVLTADSDRELAKQVIKEGAQDYLVKGDSEVELLCRTIRNAIERQRVLNELRQRLDQVLLASQSAIEIADRNADGLAVVDGEGQLLYANPAMLTMFGKSIEQLKGAPFGFPLVSGETTEIEVLRSHQQHITVEMRSATIKWEGKPAYLASLRDVTSRKSLEAQIIHAQKMEGIAILARGVAHNFNTLLNVIVCYSDMLLMNKTMEPKNISRLSKIKKAAGDAGLLTRQLLTFCRKQNLEPVRLNLNDVIRDIEPMLRSVIRKEIDLNFNLNPDLEFIHADPGQIEQVILNMIINARDALPAGGRIGIETSRVTFDRDRSLSHSYVLAGDYVLLATSDTGQGMDKATQSRMFDPFFTTKDIGNGTGLGLATVFGIITQSDGHIHVDSEVGRGTTFNIYLPIAKESTSAEISYRSPLPEGLEKILVVEDQADMRTMAQELLEILGYTVLAAENGADALNLASQHKDSIGLLLTDVAMPKMDGGQVALEIKSLIPKIKVLFMSGYPDDLLPHRGSIVEPVHMLQKPFSLDSIAKKVREVLDAN